MSVPFRARDVEAWTGAELLQGDAAARFDGVSTDTRTLGKGQLFVAIRGPHHDAHDFLDRALAAGAAGLLLERNRALPPEAREELPVLAVADSTRGLGELAAGHRGGFDGPVVAITGSNGKTTTKEMCAAILSVRAPCLKNRGNLNNEYGLPLTLLEREPEHRALVVEIGMNHRGEIAPLARIARPTVGVITNVGTAHIEHLGSQEEIAREKGDLIASLPPDATAVVNGDDPLASAQAARTPARVVRFGRGADADVRAAEVRSLGEHGFAFELIAPDLRQPVQVEGLGEPTVHNALAAAAAALAAGASGSDVAEGLSAYRSVAGRMQRIALARGGVLIDDSYNAHPPSMEVALRSLAELRGASPGIAVLGDMGELGDAAEAAHRAAGRLAGELGLDAVFSLGRFAEQVAAGAREAGVEPERVHVAGDHAELADAVKRLLRGREWVLVKGSRSMHMERVVEALAAGGKGE